MKAKFILVIMFAMALVAGGDAKAGIGFNLGGSFGLGSIDESGGYTSRSVFTTAFNSLLGYWLGPVLVGGTFDYFAVEQGTDPASVGNSNVKGSGYTVGAGILFVSGPFQVGGGIQFFGNYGVSLLSASSQTIAYKNPFGWRALIGYSVLPPLTVFGFYESAQYNTLSLGGTDSSISSTPFNHTNYGLGVSYAFGASTSLL